MPMATTSFTQCVSLLALASRDGRQSAFSSLLVVFLSLPLSFPLVRFISARSHLLSHSLLPRPSLLHTQSNVCVLYLPVRRASPAFRSRAGCHHRVCLFPLSFIGHQRSFGHRMGVSPIQRSWHTHEGSGRILYLAGLTPQTPGRLRTCRFVTYRTMRTVACLVGCTLRHRPLFGWLWCLGWSAMPGS